jgi:formylglycine-generating enzyme required for sulfatase activity
MKIVTAIVAFASVYMLFVIIGYVQLNRRQQAAATAAFQKSSAIIEVLQNELNNATNSLAEIQAKQVPHNPTEPVVPKPTDARLGKPLCIDLGNNVVMEFVWVEDAKTWVGKCEVTNEQFRRFMPSHHSGSFEGLTLDLDTQPVVQVEKNDILYFLRWLNQTACSSNAIVKNIGFPEGYKAILSYYGNGRGYPWGDDWPPVYGNFADESLGTKFCHIKGYDDGFRVSCPVLDSGTNNIGIYGLSGNVAEVLAYEEKKEFIAPGSWAEYDEVSLKSYEVEEAPLNIAGMYGWRNHCVGFRVMIGQTSPR